MEKQWRKWNGERILQPIEKEIQFALQREMENGEELKVCIGTDSQVKGRTTQFATVIVFQRKGRGGFIYLRNETSVQKMSIRERMLTEVGKSIEVAYCFCALFTGMGWRWKFMPISTQILHLKVMMH